MKKYDMDLEKLSKDATKILEKNGDGIKVAKTFGKARKTILKDLKDPSSDMTSIQIASLKALLRTALGLMVISEYSAHRFKNERSLYGSVAVATLIRDLLSDIGRLSDRSLLAGRAMNEAVDPVLSSIAMQFSNSMKQLSQEGEGVLDKKDARWLRLRTKSILDEYLPLVRESRDSIRDKVSALLENKR